MPFPDCDTGVWRTTSAGLSVNGWATSVIRGDFIPWEHECGARKIYNIGFTMRVQSIAKSLLLAFAGAGIVSFFLMMGIIPALALMQRLAGNVAQHSEVVRPAMFMRT